MSDKQRALVSFNAKYVGIAHSVCAYSAFLAALVVGCYLHYYKIIENEFYSYPEEWFPSVSATIGDRYPERSIFQILIALTAGPRFALVCLSYLRLYKPNSKLPAFGLVCGIIRTFTCGGWVYITSTDDHDWHDIFMISYIVLTIPWDVSVIKLTPSTSKLRSYRLYTCLSFFGMLVPLIYLFIQHKVHRVAGAYSYYAYCEWSLILLDIGFDTWAICDLKDLQINLATDGESSLKLDFFRKISFNEEVNSSAKEIEVVTNLDKSISKLDKFSKIKSFEQLFSYQNMLVHIINSFVFWSVLSGFLAMIWYFPLWAMGISGYEASVIGLLLTFILAIPFIRNLLANYPQISRVLGAALGVGAYLVEKPEYRLVTSATGVAFCALGLANETWYINNISFSVCNSILNTEKKSQNEDDQINDEILATLSKDLSKYYATLSSVGLLLSAIIKFAFATNNPIWPIMHKENGGWNNTGIIVGVIAALLTPNYKKINQSFSFGNSSKTLTTAPTVASVANRKESVFFSAISFGAFIFLLHALLTDSSTIITWVWDGYPIRGPIPVPHGAVSLTVIAFGIYCGLVSSRSSLINYKFYSAGVIGLILLCSFKGWMGYIGGLVLSFYLVTITPIMMENVSRFNPGLSFTLSFLFYLIFMLASVWIVAYAFVPGGPLLRERTDIVYGVPMVSVGLGILNAHLYGSDSMIASSDKSFNKIGKSLGSIKKKFQTLLLLLTVTSGVIAFLRFPFNDPTPYHPETKSFTAGIWTVHFALDNDLWAAEDRIRDLIVDLEVDIMGMLETDTQRIVMGNRDMTQKIAQDLGYYTDFGPGPNKHTWGCLLLSKFPILNSTHHLLPSPVGELAPAIHATLDIYGEYVDIFVFHSGQEEDVEDRRLQTLYLSELMGSTDRPAILLSYLVTEPHKGNYNVYVSEKSGMHDIDPTDDDRWCEYILFKRIRRTGYARVSRGTITDTEVQVGKFMLADKIALENEHLLYMNERVDVSQVPKPLRFPTMFDGDGVRGHRYHVFDEPRYFI
ncbi:Cwh43 protein [Saccharomycopsis crataegensis]|uniref:Cwh43 protein n=1 Tax=Saccharomycopsis crataegensis TaxID=43959 RepID=A0AAV5QMN4_9ASCO|nr:Cwh43 protein [Saccharomycopsis crataegensis]